MLGQAARGGGDTQGRPRCPGWTPRPQPATRRSHGPVRTAWRAAPGVECSLAVLAGSCGSGGLPARQPGRQAVAPPMPPTQGWCHRRDRPLHSSPEAPSRVAAAGRGIRSGRDPTGIRAAHPASAHHAGRNLRGQPGVGKTLTQGATVGGREDPGRRKKHRMTHLRTAGASARVAEHKRRQGPGRVQRTTRASAPARAFRQGSACTPRRQCTCIRSASGEECRPPPQRKWNRLQREHRLTLSAVSYYENNLHPDLDQRSYHHQHLRACINAAALLRVPCVGTFIGRDPSRTVAENLKLAQHVAIGADHGPRSPQPGTR